MFYWLLLLVGVVRTMPAPPELVEHAMSGLNRKMELARPVAKALLNDRVLRSHLRPTEARFLKVSLQVAALFGKSHGRFTIPTEKEKLIAMDAIYQLHFVHRDKLQHLYDSAKKLAATPRLENHEQEYAHALQKFEDLKKVIGNFEAAKNEIKLLPTVSPKLARIFGKSLKRFEIPDKRDVKIARYALEWRVRQTSRLLDNAYDHAMAERKPGDQIFSNPALQRIRALEEKMKGEEAMVKELESMPVRANP